MRKKGWYFPALWVSLFFLIGLSYDLSYGGKILSSGMTLPSFVLTGRETDQNKQYLGIKNLNAFSISQIPSKFILIDIFSLYCPICNQQAPMINQLYKLVQQDPELSKDLKIIGIGAGNNQTEVDVFRNNLRVPFPLIPDPAFKIHKKIGEPRTPFIFLVTNRGKVLFTHLGIVEDIDKLVLKIKELYNKQL